MCCTLHVEFSRLSRLEVKYNNEKSRDFTRLDLPFGDGHHPLELPMAPACGKKPSFLVIHHKVTMLFMLHLCCSLTSSSQKGTFCLHLFVGSNKVCMESRKYYSRYMSI